MSKKNIHQEFSNQNFTAQYTKTMSNIKEEINFYERHIHDTFEIYYFMQGDVNYYIEANNYQIRAGDLLVINNKEVHKPVFNSNKLYERLTIHFAPWYFSKYNTASFNLLSCFENKEPGHNNLITKEKIKNSELKTYIDNFILYLKNKKKGREIMLESFLIQILYHLNKAFDKEDKKYYSAVEYNEQITKIIKYINNNLKEKFSLDKIADKFHFNK